jgi:hypothetical protein
VFPGFPGEERRREIGRGNKPDDPSGAQFVATRPKELHRNSAERPRGITNPQRASAWVEWGVGVYMYVSVTFSQSHVLKCKSLGTVTKKTILPFPAGCYL